MAIVSDARLARLLDGAGFPRGELVTGVAIALAESGGDPGAHNPKGEDSRGLWQINVEAHPWGRNIDLYDPEVNAAAAYRVWREAGESWDPWSTYSHWFTYRDYLGRARAAVTDAFDGTATVGPQPGSGSGILRGIATMTDPEGGGPVGGIVPKAKDAASSAVGGIAGDLLGPLATADMWKRIGVGAAGVVLIVGGAVVLLRDSAGELAGALVGDVAGGALEGITQ